jgi:uncharacterized membrane protein YdjX (TVP38/TMEM64 family)
MTDGRVTLFPLKRRLISCLVRRRFAIVIAALAAIVGLAILLGLGISIPDLRILNLTADEIKQYAESWAPWSTIVSIGLMILHSFVPLPAEIIAVANGVMFGFVGGVFVTWVGAMLGAILSFALARSLGRPALRWLVSERRMRAINRWELRPAALLLARLVPLISFNLINYTAGVARVGWWPFLWTTAVGILPLTMASVLLGDTIVQASWAIAAVIIASGAILWIVLRHRRMQSVINKFFAYVPDQPAMKD